jgi:hypothetical protein
MNDIDLMIKIYNFIRAYYCEHKRGPTFREIGKNCDYAAGHLGPILAKMEELGMIKYPRRKHYGIAPVDPRRGFLLNDVANLLECAEMKQTALENNVQ